jgi:hypothetical protein
LSIAEHLRAFDLPVTSATAIAMDFFSSGERIFWSCADASGALDDLPNLFVGTGRAVNRGRSFVLLEPAQAAA